ncbi:MAG: glycosyltransferase family 4 protein [Rhodospirillales bacterium]
MGRPSRRGVVDAPIYAMHNPPLEGGGMAQRKLLVEGWRFLPHSFAIVNHWHLLALRRHPEIELRVRDLPVHFEGWQKATKDFSDAASLALLQALPAPEPGFIPDTTLRFGYPFDLAPPIAGRLGVICPNEYHVFQQASWRQPIDSAALAARDDLMVIAPSRWSAEGLCHIGIPQAKLRVVPHGVDSAVFAPDAASGAAMRRRLGLGPGMDNGVVFMNAGAMTVNKGADLLLRAFAELCRDRGDVYLLLKGTDELYRSNARLGATLHGLEPRLRELIAPRMIYGGTTLSTADMAALYRAADVYVSPYRAEGFNLPVLEAMASGLPVICTAGGSTDDFISDEAGLRIASRREPAAMTDGTTGVHLQPDFDRLVAAMTQAASDAEWRRRAGAAARAQAQRFTWDGAVDQLLQILL